MSMKINRSCDALYGGQVYLQSYTWLVVTTFLSVAFEALCVELLLPWILRGLKWFWKRSYGLCCTGNSTSKGSENEKTPSEGGPNTAQTVAVPVEQKTELAKDEENPFSPEMIAAELKTEPTKGGDDRLPAVVTAEKEEETTERGPSSSPPDEENAQSTEMTAAKSESPGGKENAVAKETTTEKKEEIENGPQAKSFLEKLLCWWKSTETNKNTKEPIDRTTFPGAMDYLHEQYKELKSKEKIPKVTWKEFCEELFLCNGTNKKGKDSQPPSDEETGLGSAKNDPPLCLTEVFGAAKNLCNREPRDCETLRLLITLFDKTKRLKKKIQDYGDSKRFSRRVDELSLVRCRIRLLAELEKCGSDNYQYLRTASGEWKESNVDWKNDLRQLFIKEVDHLQHDESEEVLLSSILLGKLVDNFCREKEDEIVFLLDIGSLRKEYRQGLRENLTAFNRSLFMDRGLKLVSLALSPFVNDLPVGTDDEVDDLLDPPDNQIDISYWANAIFNIGQFSYVLYSLVAIFRVVVGLEGEMSTWERYQIFNGIAFNSVLLILAPLFSFSTHLDLRLIINPEKTIPKGGSPSHLRAKPSLNGRKWPQAKMVALYHMLLLCFGGMFTHTAPGTWIYVWVFIIFGIVLLLSYAFSVQIAMRAWMLCCYIKNAVWSLCGGKQHEVTQDDFLRVLNVVNKITNRLYFVFASQTMFNYMYLFYAYNSKNGVSPHEYIQVIADEYHYRSQTMCLIDRSMDSAVNFISSYNWL